MSENSSDSDSVIDVDDNELLFEDEGISNAFLETLEALEENTLEFDLELTDAITEVNLSILERITVYFIEPLISPRIFDQLSRTIHRSKAHEILFPLMCCEFR